MRAQGLTKSRDAPLDLSYMSHLTLVRLKASIMLKKFNRLDRWINAQTTNQTTSAIIPLAPASQRAEESTAPLSGPVMSGSMVLNFSFLRGHNIH